MTFNPSDHPRAADGQFSEKTGAAPDVSLSADATPIVAKIVHQRWVGDYAHDTGEETEFDIRAVLDSATLDDIRSMESSGDRDWLHDDAVIAGIIEPTSGPYYVETFAVEEQLGEYIEAREAAGQEDPLTTLEESQPRIRARVGATLQGVRSALPLSIAMMETEAGSYTDARLVADGILRGQQHLNALAVGRDRLDETDRIHLDAVGSLADRVTRHPELGAIVSSADKAEVVRVMASLNDYLWNRDEVLNRPKEETPA